nr:DNA-directed DNA polymerase [Tanacetum cinerariifolium]
MRTRSSSNLIVEPITIPKQRNRRRSKQIVEPEFRTIVEILVTTMADARTMSELLQAPTKGYGDAIVIPTILADNFELKVGLLQLVTSSQFHGFERDDPHAHIRWFNKITSTLKYRNERLDESFGEACGHFKDLLRKCPHYGFSELHQIDTFYNALTQSDQDSLNATAGGNLLNHTPQDALTIIENKSKRQSLSGSGSLPSNTVANPRGDLKAITTRSGISYEGPLIPPTSFSLPKDVEREPKVTKDKVQSTSSESTAHVQPLIVQILIPEPEVVPKPNPKPSIPYPSRLNNQKLQEKTNNQMMKFLQIFQRLHFDISFTDALLHMSNFASTLKRLLINKEKLFELASTPLNENCSAVLLKKLPKKLGDPRKFLIPCDFSELEKCLALADLDASINLMPLSVWKKLSLLELTLARMTLELANRSVAYPVGVAEDFFVKVGKFHFLADFLVVDYDVDPRLDEWQSYSFGSYYCYFFPLFTPFEGSDFILKEIKTFLRTPDELSTLDDDFDLEGDIALIENLLNEDPSPNLPPMKNEDLKQVDVTMTKPSLEEPPELELKDLSPYLEYAFLEGTDKLPVIIYKELKDEEKVALLKVIKSHKQAIAWKKSEIKGIDPSFYTQKILMEDDFKPVVQHQRRVNPKIHEVIKKEVIKLLDARLIYPISDSPWISIDPQDQEKTTFTCPYRTFAYRRMPFGLCNAPGTFQRCIMAIFHEMIEETIEVFMNDSLEFKDSFSSCLSYLDKMLKRCEDTNLVLNWEKCHFMVKECIVVGHKISKLGIEVDNAKVEVIAKLPHPTSVKDLDTFSSVRRPKNSGVMWKKKGSSNTSNV